MDRRDFIKSAAQTGAVLAAAGSTEIASAQQNATSAQPAGAPDFRDVGWVWEGQGIDPKVPPSIYGLGQGAKYFGLSRVNYLFHPNDEHALRLLEGYNEVTCDISKWGWEWNDDGRPKCVVDNAPATIRREGVNVARLAKQFPNITGVFWDDMLGQGKLAGYSILAAVLIDGHRPQADAIRDFISSQAGVG